MLSVANITPVRLLTATAPQWGLPTNITTGKTPSELAIQSTNVVGG